MSGIRRNCGSRIACILATAVSPVLAVNPAPEVGFATSMDKVMIEGGRLGFPFEGWTAEAIDLHLARREHEAFQVVIMPDRNLTNAAVTVSPLVAADGVTVYDGSTEVALVGHVDVADDPLYAIHYPPHLADYHGWWPDALLTFQQTCSINSGDRVAFWIDVKSLPSTAPGDYSGTITVTATDTEPRVLQLNVHVWNFELPFRNTMETAFSSEAREARRVFGDQWSSATRYAMYDLLLAHRISPVELYRTNSPMPFEWIQYCAEGGANAFCLGKVPAIDPADLDGLVSQMKSAGLFEMSFVYGFDEVAADKFPNMAATFDAIHARHPGLRTATTARDYTFGTSPSTSYLREPVDIWVPPIEWFNAAEAVALRSEGKQMWWYNGVSPRHPYPNWFVEYPAIEARLLMGSMAYKFQTGGHLYWSVARWINNSVPIDSGPYTSWDPRSYLHSSGKWVDGDGSILLPGPDGPIPTIRLANIRDGLEDFEYLARLREVTQIVNLCPISPERQSFVNDANALLAVPASIVASRTTYTRDAQALYSFRQQVAQKIIEGEALLPPADLDGDCDVDDEDFALFQNCASGPAIPYTSGCEDRDFDGDGDADQVDFAMLQRLLQGRDDPAEALKTP